MNILIIEDEARIAKRLARMTRTYFEHQLELTICDSLPKGLAHIDNAKVDLLLLDLNLNGENGFSVLESMVARSFHTIVVSAYTERAITAFTYGVLDFVPKPFHEARLFQAFDRLNSSKPMQETKLEYLAIKKGGMVRMVEANQVNYIQGAGIYSEIHLLDGSHELHNKSLEALEQLLPVADFMRVHRSYLVNLKQTEKLLIEAGGRYALTLKNGEIVPVGRSRYKDVLGKMI